MAEAGRKLGIVGGAGDLPYALAKHCADIGRPFFVSRMSGISNPNLAEFDGAEHSLAAIGERMAALKVAGVIELVFVGNVSRPDFSQMMPDFRGAVALPRLIKAAKQGDDALLRAVLKEFEKEGFNILGADDVMGDLLIGQGLLAGPALRDMDLADLRHGAQVARTIGQLDIGQGAVVAGGLVLAVEAQEGTDAMLQRVAGLPPQVRGKAKRRLGILVKCPKPQQERRIDLPTIGPETLRLADAALLAGIAVEAGAALVMDKPALMEEANKRGLFVYGFSDQDLIEAP